MLLCPCAKISKKNTPPTVLFDAPPAQACEPVDTSYLRQLVGYNAPKRQHTTIITAILATNFAGNTINPSLAAGIDPRSRGGFVIPSVDFVLGDHWRLKLEADLFFAPDKRQPSLTSVSGISENKTYLFGALANHDQFLVRLTRQF